MWSLLEVAPQCCDAFTYTGSGQQCADFGVCAGGIRPMGVYYWFSIPARFGLPLNSLIALNILLMLLSTWLSTLALGRGAGMHNRQRTLRWPALTVLGAISFCVHLFFLYPILFNTLSDSPSSCFLLSGLWLLLLSEQPYSNFKKALCLAVAGLCLGLAAWIRAFYLYPVLGGLAVYVVAKVCSHKRRWCELFILLALLPIGSQYLYSFLASGKFSYLDDEADRFVVMHSSLAVAGYDTLFPADGYFWQPRYCHAGFGIMDGLKAHEFMQVGCLVKERLYFYLGTYVPNTYIFNKVTNQLEHSYADRVGDAVYWFSDGLRITPDAVKAPAGSGTSHKFTVMQPTPSAKIFRSITLRDYTAHTFSVWLWSPQPLVVNLMLIRNIDQQAIAAQKVTLTPEPLRYFTTGTTQGNPGYLPASASIESTQYSVVIEYVPDQLSTETGSVAEKFFYAWGAQVEASDHMTAYRADEDPEPNTVRVWQPWLLALNICVMLMALILVIVQRRQWLQTCAGWAVIVAIAIAIAECITIIPEQRFAVTIMIFMWLMAAALIVPLMDYLFQNLHKADPPIYE